MIQISVLYIDFEGAKILYVLKSSYRALEDAGGSWLGFGILIMIWIWSLIFGTIMFWILALYLHFEDANNIHVL